MCLGWVGVGGGGEGGVVDVGLFGFYSLYMRHTPVFSLFGYIDRWTMQCGLEDLWAHMNETSFLNSDSHI